MNELKTYLLAIGGRQQDLADLIGISRPYLSGLLSGKKRPSLDLALRIEDVTRGAVPAASWRKGCCEAAE